MQKLRRIERALKAGEWFEAAKATRVFADIAIGIGLVAGAGAAIYSANKQGQIANSELTLQGNQARKQDQAFDQLQQLLNDPGSFFKSPVYQSAFNQGSAATARSSAAQFGPNSGNEKQALQAFGQGFGQTQLFNQEQLLAGMSGTGFNPAGAGAAASGAASSAAGGLSSLAGLLSFFGTSGMGKGGGGGGGGSGAEVPIGDDSGLFADAPVS